MDKGVCRQQKEKRQEIACLGGEGCMYRSTASTGRLVTGLSQSCIEFVAFNSPSVTEKRTLTLGLVWSHKMLSINSH